MNHVFHRATALRPTLTFIRSSSSVAAAGDDNMRRRADPHQWRCQEEESRRVRVAVWWDFENCQVPAGANVCRITQRITDALRSSGIRGPVSINAFGDVAQLTRSSQEALTATGVSLTHVPRSGKNSSDWFFMADLVYWVSQNPPPMHFFLISGDRDFANILHRLRMSNYNILLASNDTTSEVLCSAATIMWPWHGLAKGENLSVKHFNHPPDGTYGSWYNGHNKSILDVPFKDADLQINSQPEESMELIAETKPRPIPKAVVNGIRQILQLYPEGINLSELRAELKKNNVPMEKDFFGHKKFSQLLLSMPYVLKFASPSLGEGQPLVVCAQRKKQELINSISKPSSNVENCNEERNHTSHFASKSVQTPLIKKEASPVLKTKTSMDNIEHHTVKDANSDANSDFSTPSKGKADESEKSFFKRIWKSIVGPQSIMQNQTIASKSVSGSQPILSNPTLSSNSLCSSQPTNGSTSRSSEGTDGQDIGGVSPSENYVQTEESFCSRFWRVLVGSGDGYSVDDDNKVLDVSVVNAGKGASKYSVDDNKVLDVSSENSSKGAPVPLGKSPSSSLATPLASSDVTKSLLEGASYKQAKDGTDASSARTGFLMRILCWLKFWKPSSEFDSSSVKDVGNDQESNSFGDPSRVSLQACPSEGEDPFANSHFWDSLESFLLTAKGSDIILRSRTRQQLVLALQKEGPCNLKDLNGSNLFRLVSLLLSEKKWITESAFRIFPFQLTLPVKQSYAQSQVPGHNGLSSLFMGMTSPSIRQRIPHDKQDQNAAALVNGFHGTVNIPQNLPELRSWFRRTYTGPGNIETDYFRKLFESKFNQNLDCSIYGHQTLQNLLNDVLDSNDDEGEKKKRTNREEMLSDCHKLILELLDENPDGYSLSAVRPAFFQRYGYILDYKMLGYPRLASLLEIMPDVRIESSFVLPVGKFDSAPCLSMAADKETDHAEGGKGRVNDVEQQRATNEDSAWDELGPVSKMAASEDDTNKEHFEFKAVSLSDEEFSDTECYNPPQLVGSEGKCKSDDDSSLLQILDSFYGNKENNDMVQNQTNLKNNYHSPSNVKHRAPVWPSPKQRSYTFVSKTEDDKKKLVDNILHSLRKGESQLQS